MELMMKLNLPYCRRSRCGEMAPPGMSVCSQCMESLCARLRGTRDFERAVITAQANEMKFSRETGTHSGGRPTDMIPFNERLSTVAAEWRNQIQLSALSIAEALSLDPVMGLASCAEFIADNCKWIQRHEHGAAMVDFLNGLYSQVERLVDAPPDRFFVGTCGEALEDMTVCETKIYSVDGQEDAVCSGCGFSHAVYGRRNSLKAQARKVALPPTALARAVDGLGIVEVTARQISKWHERGKLTPVRHTADARRLPMFLVGDVLDLVDALALTRM